MGALLVLVLVLGRVCGEERQVAGCGELVLACGEAERLVVNTASFIPLLGEDGCGGREGEGEEKREVLGEVVRRCNGARGDCTFSLEREVPQSLAWGRGRTEVSIPHFGRETAPLPKPDERRKA